MAPLLLRLTIQALLSSALATNPIYPNLGATGPTDATNARIFTHAFVHRTHLDIHGRFFPRAFANWYSDDWISNVYGASSTFKLGGVRMRHQVETQKTAGPERYAVDHAAERLLAGEVSHGMLRTQRWLANRSSARLPLPDLCGYVPLVELDEAEPEGATHGAPVPVR
tara:strand:+ start:282 stop:785 length:504 start_codon:yes stop_codon:yes gene_type:complete